MKTKLGSVIILIEIAALSLLFFFLILNLKLNIFPSNTSIILVYLLPISFGLHIFEEFFFPGGGEEWFRAYRPVYADSYTPTYFFLVNAIPLFLLLLTCLGVFDYIKTYSDGIYPWFIFMSGLALNGLIHIRATIRDRKYSPGVISSLLLFLPLAVISIIYFFKINAFNIYLGIICLAAGALLQPILNLIKKIGVKKETKI
jgi:hypothetical protein